MGVFGVEQSPNGVWFGTFNSLTEYRRELIHGISTRLGGKSKSPFATLNLGLHIGDEADTVWYNRQEFCSAVGISAEKMVTADQVHGDNIAVVTVGDAGRGAKHYSEAIGGTDALITNVPGIPLMLFFADCVPVLIFDPIKKAIGISHAGWKGTVSKIAQKTVLALSSQYGTRPSDCLAVIGPSIGPCCYEVDEAVMSRLRAEFTYWQDLVTPVGDRWKLDLWETNKRQLIDIGVKSDNVEKSSVCTACNTSIFFSHRAEAGRTGRLGAVIALAR